MLCQLTLNLVWDDRYNKKRRNVITKKIETLVMKHCLQQNKK
jgi:hypothetical protein